MTTTLQRRIAGATIAAVAIIAAYFAVAILSNLLGMAIAHADTGQPQPPERDWMLYAIFGMSVAGRILHFVAPRTKTKVDDAWAARIDRIEAIVTGGQPPASGTIDGKP